MWYSERKYQLRYREGNLHSSVDLQNGFLSSVEIEPHKYLSMNARVDAWRYQSRGFGGATGRLGAAFGNALNNCGAPGKLAAQRGDS